MLPKIRGKLDARAFKILVLIRDGEILKAFENLKMIRSGPNAQYILCVVLRDLCLKHESLLTFIESYRRHLT